jgi:hypothetical protein
MTKREQYDEIVAQVEADLPLIVEYYPTSYEEAVVSDSLTISINGEAIRIDNFPIGVVSDYAVRDSLMVRSVADERFGLILTSKVGKYVETKLNNGESLNQDDIEALVMGAQITTMWEQFDTSKYLLGLITDHADDNLTIPKLASITAGMIQHYKELNFSALRKEMITDLKGKIDEALNG